MRYQSFYRFVLEFQDFPFRASSINNWRQIHAFCPYQPIDLTGFSIAPDSLAGSEAIWELADKTPAKISLHKSLFNS
jgi:hypothetical protein